MALAAVVVVAVLVTMAWAMAMAVVVVAFKSPSLTPGISIISFCSSCHLLVIILTADSQGKDAIRRFCTSETDPKSRMSFVCGQGAVLKQ